MTAAAALTADLKRWCREEGFAAVGVSRAQPGLGMERLDEWLAEGRHGAMRYMADRRDVRADPSRVLAGVKAVVSVALPYRTAEPDAEATARVSRYAWGEDYHDVFRRKHKAVGRRCRDAYPDVRLRGVVDSAPVPERDYARAAGLGWFGKNTLLLSRSLGSFLFLGAILVDHELVVDEPFRTDHCGSCRRCLDACPTDAFDGPYRLDPRKCISYQTIEQPGDVPEPLAELLGGWTFGCDVCQDVCPWNRFAPQGGDAFAPADDLLPTDLAGLLRLTAEQFDERFRGTPLHRTGRVRVLRNACLVVGGRGLVDLLPLVRDLAEDAAEDPVLRRAAAWAVVRCETSESSGTPPGSPRAGKAGRRT